MTRPLRVLAVALTLGAGALLAACDLAGTPRGTDTLLLDARLARQSGDLAEAIALLEEAHTLDPAHAAVRVELSAAYLERDGIDLLDIDRLMLFVTGTPATAPRPAADVAAGGPAGGRVGGTCPYGGDPTAVPFALRDVEGYPALLAREAAVGDVLVLLHEASGGAPAVVPPALRAAGLCTAVEGDRLAYDRDGALAALRATGLTDAEIASALAVNGAARFLASYFALAEELSEHADWYRLADGALGVCAGDPEAFLAQTERALADLFEGLAALDLRAELLGTTPTREIVDHGVAAFEALRVPLAPTCGA